MGSSRHKITLTDIGTSQTTIGQHNQKHKERLTLSLFDGNLKTLVNYFKEHYIYHEDDNAFLESVFNILENVSHQDLKTSVEMVIDYTEEQYKVALRICLPPIFVEKVKGFLINPKLVIRGDFIVTSGKTSGSGSNSKSGLPNRNCTFYHSDIDLLQEKSVQSFQGDHHILDIMNGSKFVSKIVVYTTISMEWERFGLDLHEERVNVLEKLLNHKFFTDCVIVAENKAEVSCHRNVIAAHSDVLFAMLTSGMKESQTNRIEMEEVSEAGVDSLVNYFYRNKVDENTDEQVALELLQTAHKYNISKLEAVMLNTVYSKPDEWLSIGNVLHLYLYSRNVDGFCYEMLRQRMFKIMKKFPVKLKDSEEFKRFVNAGAQVETDTEFAEVIKLCMSSA
ncbi:unnamed protein product [Orchesella dallaii]|uniref:BTB domain-containing protein n=1 Tax=Orchesella dallaii TaxID=48710 RepID=A0ABP1RPX6_9HEXA